MSYRFTLTATVLSLAIGLFSCAPAPTSQQVSVLSYNVLSLFDATDCGKEYQDFSVSKGRWGESAYKRRLDLLAELILKLNRRGPDVACLIEIENEGVLRDLNARLQKAHYQYLCCAQSDSATTLGLLSRYPIVLARTHTLQGSCLGEGGAIIEPGDLRPILEAKIRVGDSELVLFLNHWKSKLGDAVITENIRRKQAELLASLLRDQAEREPSVPALALGDFNENPDEYFLNNQGYPTAFGYLDTQGGSTVLEPPEPEAAPILLGDSADAPAGAALKNDKTTLFLVSPWLSASHAGEYSYFYDGHGERIDNILLEPSFFDGEGWEFKDFECWKPSCLLNAEGLPEAWKTSAGRGYSDHLPLVVTLSCPE
jgi:endonuclease/exonuclease/phosphatase family metal-dependent hydrolase